MGKGKIGAQCGHATLSTYLQATKMAQKSPYWKQVLNQWMMTGMKKVCVKVTSHKELEEVQEQAHAIGIPNAIIRDAGHTQLEAGSSTVCGLGPAAAAHIDLITNEKKLL